MPVIDCVCVCVITQQAWSGLGEYRGMEICDVTLTNPLYGFG